MKLKIVGYELQALRKKLKLSRRTIAKRHGFSVNTIKVWENGSTEPGFFKLANYLKIFSQYGVNITICNLLESAKQLEQKIIDKISTEQIAKNDKILEDLVNQSRELIHINKRCLLQELLENKPFRIFFKDECNKITNLNNKAAVRFGGTVSELENIDNYHIFPFNEAKAYHEDDLTVINTEKSLVKKEELTAINSKTTKTILTHKIPIILEEKRKIILGVFEDVPHIAIKEIMNELDY